MLSKPNVSDIEDKVGNRYEIAMAVAKRARTIANKRVEFQDPDITDAVDVAAKEIAAGKVIVTKEDKISEIEETTEEVEE